MTINITASEPAAQHSYNATARQNDDNIDILQSRERSQAVLDLLDS